MMASPTVFAAAAATLCLFAYFDVAKAFTEEQLAMIEQLHNSCVEETGVDEALITNFRTGNLSEDPKLKCYMKCTLEQIAVIDEQGNIDGDAMIAMLPEEFEEDGPPVVRKCAPTKGADACDTAYLFNKCLYEHNPERYMLI